MSSCLFLDEKNRRCQASGEQCSVKMVGINRWMDNFLGIDPKESCIETAPEGDFDLITRGEVEEAFAFLGFSGDATTMRSYIVTVHPDAKPLPDIDLDE